MKASNWKNIMNYSNMFYVKVHGIENMFRKEGRHVSLLNMFNPEKV